MQAALSHVTDFTHATVPEEEGTIGNNSPQLQQIFQGPRPGPASKAGCISISHGNVHFYYRASP